MSRRKPETVFRNAINKIIANSLHRQPNVGSSMSMSGVPDMYYDALLSPGRDLWVEYKKNTTMPRDGIVRGDYSKLQLRWMRRRYDLGKNVVGIIGLPNARAIIQHTPRDWLEGTHVNTDVLLTHAEVAAWIKEYCGAS